VEASRNDAVKLAGLLRANVDDQAVGGGGRVRLRGGESGDLLGSLIDQMRK
jgi:hypothetical protein